MGFLEMYIGPMFSGKTSLLLSKISQYEDDVFVITHESDTRYGKNEVISHSNNRHNASVACSTLMPLILSKKLLESSYVAIEEAQFFDDITSFVKYIINNLDKHVFIAGLDGDYNMNPFSNITNLIPFADVVLKLNARCYVCNNTAPFTKRIVDSEQLILVGAGECYKPVCRKHYGCSSSVTISLTGSGEEEDEDGGTR